MQNAPDGKGGGKNPENSSRSWALDRLPWPEVGRILARDPRLIVPIGALIQHGPHLPLGTNTFIVRRVAEEASRRFCVLLAPTLDYGVWREGKESYAGASGVRRKTLHRALNELLAGWEDHGIREFLILTAHQQESHLDALLMAMTSSATTNVVNLFTIDAADLLEAPPIWEHGGELETSLMLHLAPHLVRMDQATDLPSDASTYRKYAQGGVATPPPGSRGTLGHPSRATAGKGEAVFQRYVDALGEILGGEPSISAQGMKVNPGRASSLPEEDDS
jgi:creatinine amidohydrolase